MEQKIKNFREVVSYIKKNTYEHFSSIKNNNGYNQYLRALTAQLLWLLLLYSLTIKLIPVQDWLVSNVIFLVLFGIFSFLWITIKEKLPSWLTEYAKGECFYTFELPFLNKCIICLFLINLVILVPWNLFKSLFKKKLNNPYGR
jgi:hypothetical protein